MIMRGKRDGSHQHYHLIMSYPLHHLMRGCVGAHRAGKNIHHFNTHGNFRNQWSGRFFVLFVRVIFLRWSGSDGCDGVDGGGGRLYCGGGRLQWLFRCCCHAVSEGV